MTAGKPIEFDEPEGDPRPPFALLTHGAGGDLNSAGLKAFSSALAKTGHLSVRTNLAYREAGRKTPPAAEKSVEGFIKAFESAASRYDEEISWVLGGRSYGGRVASLAAAGGLRSTGLIFFPYPLHRPGDPSSPRASHWPKISVPCLFVQGTSDPFCNIEVLQGLLPTLGAKPTLLLVEGGDHSLKVRADKQGPRRGKSEEEVAAELMGPIEDWLNEL